MVGTTEVSPWPGKAQAEENLRGLCGSHTLLSVRTDHTFLSSYPKWPSGCVLLVLCSFVSCRCRPGLPGLSTGSTPTPTPGTLWLERLLSPRTRDEETKVRRVRSQSTVSSNTKTCTS